MTKQGLKVLDCTIRDGGLINNHRFERPFVRDLFTAVSESGVDWIELGYRNTLSPEESGEHGLYKHLEDNEIEQIISGTKSKIKVSVMVDVGRVDISELQPSDRSPVDMIRIATYVEKAAEAVDLSKVLAEKGYETAINIMAVSRDRGPDLTAALHLIGDESPARIVYIVDSFGALRPGETAELAERFTTCLPGKVIGFHGHNNMQLAFANTLEAIRHGATYADGTVFGMGRAAGNCPLELLIGHLDDDRYDLAPILSLISNQVLPLRKTMEWGYIIPYALTGLLNIHPRPAMALRKSASKDDYMSFYKDLSENGGR